MVPAPKILIVDDEPAIVRLLRIAFTHAGFEVVTALGADTAIEACRSQTFDVMLTDVRMPGLNGHELARWIAANQPAVRTVLMSGYPLECEECPNSPCCLLLHKPFQVEEAVLAVRQVLDLPR